MRHKRARECRTSINSSTSSLEDNQWKAAHHLSLTQRLALARRTIVEMTVKTVASAGQKVTQKELRVFVPSADVVMERAYAPLHDHQSGKIKYITFEEEP